jgi:membrane protein implicated in regulation of membrane protease activity
MTDLLSTNLPAVIWFSLTGALLIAEMFSGSFYLLALSLGTLAGGVLAYHVSPLEQQLGIAILVSSIATFVIWLNRRPNHDNTHNDDPDVGQSVKVIALEPLTVHYRGADWQAALLTTSTLTPDVGATLHIHSKHANSLIVG